MLILWAAIIGAPVDFCLMSRETPDLLLASASGPTEACGCRVCGCQDCDCGQPEAKAVATPTVTRRVMVGYQETCAGRDRFGRCIKRMEPVYEDQIIQEPAAAIPWRVEYGW